MKIPFEHLKTHETKREVLIKFIGVLIIFIAYFIYVSLKFGVKEGFLVAWLTWSFFVLCTPIADAGLLIAFPLRLILGIRMLYVQVVLFFIAALLAIATLIFSPTTFEKTLILKIFKAILTTPLYWIIIFISIIGTIFSIMFGDEMLDVIMHKDRTTYHKHHLKYELLLYFFFFVIVFIIYQEILKQMGIPLI